MEEYDVPDEHLSYSELKDRIIEECAKVKTLQKKIADETQERDNLSTEVKVPKGKDSSGDVSRDTGEIL